MRFSRPAKWCASLGATLVFGGVVALAAPLLPGTLAGWVGTLLVVGGALLILRTARTRSDVERAAPDGTSAFPRTGNAADAADEAGQPEGLSAAYARLKEIDRQKDAFLSSVSHEFRTPLSSIRSFSEILLNYEQEDPDTMNEFISIIHEESERLSRLVDDLLDLTKIESGCAEWRMTRLSLEPVVETVLRNASPLARAQDVSLHTTFAEFVPAIEGDRDRLLQVLTNLVSNALKFAPRRSRIDVSLRVEDGTLRVDVEDEGPGVPEPDRERIFEKFHQAQQPEWGAPRGTGLGLPISREIVQHHGGRLWVEARQPRGSRFSFTVPVLSPVT